MKEIIREHNPNGTLGWQCPYLDGQPHGIGKAWDIDGKLDSEYEYRNGNHTGVSKHYNNDLYRDLFTSKNFFYHGIHITF